jgi:hypothetical protein
MVTIVIAVLLIIMLSALGMGLFFLARTPVEGDNGGSLARALTWRIGSWVVLFGFILISIEAGWIMPRESFQADKSKQFEIPTEQLAINSSDGMLMLTAVLGTIIGILLVLLGRKGKQMWMWVWGYGLVACSIYLGITMKYGVKLFTYF